MRRHWGGGRRLAALSSSPIAPLMPIRFSQVDPSHQRRQPRPPIADGMIAQVEPGLSVQRHDSLTKADSHELRYELLLRLAIHPAGDRSRRRRSTGHTLVLIAAGRLITGLPGTGVLAPGYLTVSGGLITEVGEGVPPGPPDLELRAGVLVPGLVDLQVNGYYGVDLADCDPDGWAL